MHGMGKTVNELHAMLKLHQDSLPKKDANPALHAIRAGRVQKTRKINRAKLLRGVMGKGKNKMGYAHNNVPFAPKPKTSPPPKKDNPAKDAICHQCGEVGHWRRNCPVYLTELMKKKKLSQGASTLGGSVEDHEVNSRKKITNPSVDTSINHEEDDQAIDDTLKDIRAIRIRIAYSCVLRLLNMQMESKPSFLN
ncbi:zinc finger, CCHC-type containing protein [Tanacetum coccineum]